MRKSVAWLQLTCDRSTSVEAILRQIQLIVDVAIGRGRFVTGAQVQGAARILVGVVEAIRDACSLPQCGLPGKVPRVVLLDHGARVGARVPGSSLLEREGLEMKKKHRVSENQE